MAKAVTVEGLDEVLRKFEHLGRADLPHIALTTYAADVQEKARPYPPESEANRPPEPYYRRGVGTVTTNKVYRTSQDMKSKWQVKSTSKLIELRNKATYSDFVQGQRRADYHIRRGWQSAHDIAKNNLKLLERRFNQVLEREWAKG